MAYDTARGVTILFGGYLGESSYSDETWEWDGNGGGAWAHRTLSGPSAQVSQAMAYDAARGVPVLFGGSINANPYLVGETWELRLPCVAPTIAEPTVQLVCQGNAATFATTPSGTGPFTFQWRHSGQPL